MLTLTQRNPNPYPVVDFILALTAEERTRSRHRFEADGQVVFLGLPRGTVLRDGDILQDAVGSVSVKIMAKAEPVLTVVPRSAVDLARAAYHLGNRHVALEITSTYLRLSPDPVLQAMLQHLGLDVEVAVLPFQPEMGAYGHHHHAS
ncbi:MAG: urease accessory protein UreE [Nostocaceae cyanobacterium]|nr:urease accessory protein UreE [Nostocaceae cyanobacterium]